MFSTILFSLLSYFHFRPCLFTDVLQLLCDDKNLATCCTMCVRKKTEVFVVVLVFENVKYASCVCVCVCCQLFVLHGGASIAQVIRTLRNVTETRSLPNELRKIKKDNEKKKTSTIESVKKKAKTNTAHVTRTRLSHTLFSLLFFSFFLCSLIRLCVCACICAHERTYFSSFLIKKNNHLENNRIIATQAKNHKQAVKANTC